MEFLPPEGCRRAGLIYCRKCGGEVIQYKKNRVYYKLCKGVFLLRVNWDEDFKYD